ncbi:ABC transporter permease [Clostridium paridis]|uniref:ABC transporter permease n=1 Tax=Clostridium paridis TaxID=2803863 RepID=A0A937FBT8_9CLOT|nr:ABC transporter permease [Clostridium paridis]
MLNLIQADIFKLRKSFAVKVLVGITTFSSIVMALMAYFIPKGTIDKSMTGIGFMFSDINMMSIIGAVIAGIFICGDFDNKVIHTAISSGYSRGTVIAGKSIVFLISIGILLIPYALVAVISLNSGLEFSMGSVGVGFLNLITRNSGVTLTLSYVGKLVAIILTLIVVYGAQLSICIPISLTIRRPVFVIAIYYGITILFAQLVGLKDKFQVLSDIFSWTPYGGNYTFLTLDSGVGDIFKALIVSLAFIVIMMLVSYSVFRKAEIK